MRTVGNTRCGSWCAPRCRGSQRLSDKKRRTWRGSCLAGRTQHRFGHAHGHCVNYSCECSVIGRLLLGKSPRRYICRCTGITRPEHGGAGDESPGCAILQGRCFCRIRPTWNLSSGMRGQWRLTGPESVTSLRVVSSAGPRQGILGVRCVFVWVVTGTSATSAAEVWDLLRVGEMLKQQNVLGAVRCASTRGLW